MAYNCYSRLFLYYIYTYFNYIYYGLLPSIIAALHFCVVGLIVICVCVDL